MNKLFIASALLASFFLHGCASIEHVNVEDPSKFEIACKDDEQTYKIYLNNKLIVDKAVNPTLIVNANHEYELLFWYRVDGVLLPFTKPASGMEVRDNDSNPIITCEL